MPIETFSVLLGKLGSSATEDAELEGAPAFRVSSKVAEVMLSLGSVLARNEGRASPYYEETSASAPPAPLSLSELKEHIARAASTAELRRLRRRFAVFSHPDHKGVNDARATRDMAAANQMIDEAILSLRRPR